MTAEQQLHLRIDAMKWSEFKCDLLCHAFSVLSVSFDIHFLAVVDIPDIIMGLFMIFGKIMATIASKICYI